VRHGHIGQPPSVKGQCEELACNPFCGRILCQFAVDARRSPQRAPASLSATYFAPDIAAIDLFVVPTIGFNLMYAFVIVRLERRDLVWINVTPKVTPFTSIRCVGVSILQRRFRP
jgi:hypothetical protein